MQIKVTKVFAKYVDKLVKTLGIAEEAHYALVGPMNYPGGTFTNPDSDMDYDLESDRYRVIEVVYPYDHYAMPCVISTPMLMEAVKRFDGKITVSQLNDILRDMIEI